MKKKGRGVRERAGLESEPNKRPCASYPSVEVGQEPTSQTPGERYPHPTPVLRHLDLGPRSPRIFMCASLAFGSWALFHPWWGLTVQDASGSATGWQTP